MAIQISIASTTIRQPQRATTDAYEAHHPEMGTGTLYRYLSKDGSSLVARFFPRDFTKGCVYIPAKRGISPDTNNDNLATLMGLEYITGEVPVAPNFRITDACQYYVSGEMSIDDENIPTLHFSVTWRGNTQSMSLELPRGLDYENGAAILDYLTTWSWNFWPGSKLHVR